MEQVGDEQFQPQLLHEGTGALLRPGGSLLDAVSFVQGRHPAVVKCNGVGCSETEAETKAETKAEVKGKNVRGGRTHIEHDVMTLVQNITKISVEQPTDYLASFMQLFGSHQDDHKDKHRDKGKSKGGQPRTSSAFWIVLGVLVFLLIIAYIMSRQLRAPKPKEGTREFHRFNSERSRLESPPKSESSGPCSEVTSSKKSKKVYSQYSQSSAEKSTKLLQPPSPSGMRMSGRFEPQGRPQPPQLLPDFNDDLGIQSLPLASGPLGSQSVVGKNNTGNSQQQQEPGTLSAETSPLSPGLTAQRRAGIRTSFLSNGDGTGSCDLEAAHGRNSLPQQNMRSIFTAAAQNNVDREHSTLSLRVPDTPSAAAPQQRKRLCATVLNSFFSSGNLQRRGGTPGNSASSMDTSRRAHRSDTSSTSASLSASTSMWTTYQGEGMEGEDNGSQRSSVASSGMGRHSQEHPFHTPGAQRLHIYSAKLLAASNHGGKVEVTRPNGSASWMLEVNTSANGATMNNLKVRDMDTAHSITIRPMLREDRLIGGHTFELTDEDGKRSGSLRFTELGATLYSPDNLPQLEFHSEATRVEIAIRTREGQLVGRLGIKGFGDANHLELFLEPGVDTGLMLSCTLTLAVYSQRS